MKRKVLCIALALLMCAMVVLPTFADGEAETPPERAPIVISFGLKNVSGSTYRMWARVDNPLSASVSITLSLYDGSYNHIKTIGATLSDPIFTIYKDISLSSGTYYLKVVYSVTGHTYAARKTYHI